MQGFSASDNKISFGLSVVNSFKIHTFLLPTCKCYQRHVVLQLILLLTTQVESVFVYILTWFMHTYVI